MTDVSDCVICIQGLSLSNISKNANNLFKQSMQVMCLAGVLNDLFFQYRLLTLQKTLVSLSRRSSLVEKKNSHNRVGGLDTRSS